MNKEAAEHSAAFLFGYALLAFLRTLNARTGSTWRSAHWCAALAITQRVERGVSAHKSNLLGAFPRRTLAAAERHRKAELNANERRIVTYGKGPDREAAANIPV